MAGAHSLLWWFLRHHKTQVERESSKECSDSFLRTNESFSLWNCLSRNSTLFVFFTADQSAWPVLNQPRQRGFLRNLRYSSHSVLYGQRKYVFKRKSFCLERFHGRFLHFGTGVKEKHKMCIWNWFFAICSADLTCVNGSRIQLVLYVNCFLGSAYGFLNKTPQA